MTQAGTQRSGTAATETGTATGTEAAPSRPGRLRSAFQVLRGESLVPDQIRVEWLEYQSIFNDLLTRYSASLARQAKAEKKRITALSMALDGPAPELRPPVPPQGSKAELRQRAAVYLHGGSPLAHQLEVEEP